MRPATLLVPFTGSSPATPSLPLSPPPESLTHRSTIRIRPPPAYPAVRHPSHLHLQANKPDTSLMKTKHNIPLSAGTAGHESGLLSAALMHRGSTPRARILAGWRAGNYSLGCLGLRWYLRALGPFYCPVKSKRTLALLGMCIPVIAGMSMVPTLYIVHYWRFC